MSLDGVTDRSLRNKMIVNTRMLLSFMDLNVGGLVHFAYIKCHLTIFLFVPGKPASHSSIIYRRTPITSKYINSHYYILQCNSVCRRACGGHIENVRDQNKKRLIYVVVLCIFNCLHVFIVQKHYICLENLIQVRLQQN